MSKKIEKERTWLILAHLFNVDGNAASQTITDRIPFFQQEGIHPVVLSSPTGKRDRSFPHYQVLSAAPSGFLFELRNIINRKFKSPFVRRALKTLLLVVFLPFYTLEKIFVQLDSHWSWFISASVRGLFLVRKFRPKVVYSTAGPSSTHLAGFILSRLCNIPWLAELHDPLIYDEVEKKWQFYYFKKWIEKKICQHASAVIYFTDRALESAQRRNGNLCKGYVIRPGVEPPYSFDIEYHKKDKIHFGHFGTLAEDRNLRVVIRAFYELLRENPELRDKVSLDIYGGQLDEISRKYLQDFPLGDVLYEYGRLEYDPVAGKTGRQRVLEAMFQCDALLLLHGEGVMCDEYIPSKFYEYLFTGRPIIGLVSQGSELDAMLRRNNRVSVAGTDSDSVRQEILKYIRMWERDQLPHYDNRQPYTVYAATQKMIRIVDDIVSRRKDGLDIVLEARSILIIMRRSLGDVLATSPLVNVLHEFNPEVQIDLLVNDDTYEMAKAIRYVRKVHNFSYNWSKRGFWGRWKNEITLIRDIIGRYDLAISLTANERSTIYAILAGKFSLAVTNILLENSLWRNLLLSKTYTFEANCHIVMNNLATIKSLGVPVKKVELSATYTDGALQRVRSLLNQHRIKRFLIFHPSARFEYKIYPQHLRDELLQYLCRLDIPIVITGGRSELDLQISAALPKLPNLYNFIGKTSLEEAIVLTALSEGYVGMDTFNMHIAAALNKKVIAIFGPTNPKLWSPWSNSLQTYAKGHGPVQRYGNITLIQADLKCVACGLAGCDDKNSVSRCFNEIMPETIFEEVQHAVFRDDHQMIAAWN